MYDNRNAVPDSRRIDDSHIYASREAWVQACNVQRQALDGFDADQHLDNLLKEFESLSARDQRLRTYASLRADLNTKDDERANDEARAESLHADLMANRDRVEQLIRERMDADTAVIDIPSRFERYVTDAVERRGHALAPAAADLLGSLNDVLDAPARVHTALVDGESVSLTPGERSQILREADRDVRRRAFRAIRDTHRDRRETMAANLDTMARRNVRLADARDYDSALAAGLAGDDPYVACRPQGRLPQDAYDALVDGVRANLGPKHRLGRHRRDALGVDELCPWDSSAVPNVVEPPRYEFEEALEVILAAVEPLGESYRDQLRTLFDERRIDAFDYPAKTDRGARYATSAPGSGPFVVTRWQGTLASLFLLAHELGHAVHSHFAAEAQPHVTAGIPGPTSELPSKLHEVLLADYLLGTTSGDERTAVADRAVRSIGANLFYSARWATFAHALHERVGSGDRLTADWLDETYGDLYSEFNSMVRRTDRLDAGWQAGLYRVPLYHHYPYILGTVGALAVAEGIGDALSPEDYRGFLAAGTSKPAVKALDDLGVDATSGNAVAVAVGSFGRYVDAYRETTTQS